MKIMLIGGGGYVGTQLASRLVERNYHIHVVDKFMFGNFLPKEISTTKKDVFEITEEEMSMYDCVIFLAGISNDPMAEYDPAQNFIANAAAPAYTAYLASRTGVKRYIYASSCSVYGFTHDEMSDELYATDVQYPYGVSKLQGERGVLHFIRQKQTNCTNKNNFSVIALRKGTISGHSERMRFDLIVNTMFKHAVKDGVINVTNPAIWRPVLAMRDATTAYIRAIEANESISGIFNIASENCTVGYVADCVKEVVEERLGRVVSININHVSDMRNYKATIEKAGKVLSFFPQYAVKNIVSELCDHLDDYGDFSNQNYYNIEVFKR